MDSECKTFWHLGVACPAGHSLPMAGELEGVERLATDFASPRSIVLGSERRESAAPVPGYNALAPQIRTVRDPALSLIALSGIDPSDPVMVEVPLVLNNTSFTDTPMISGWRIGFAQRYMRGDHSELVEHAEAFLRALGVLRQLGAQLVPVDAQRGDNSFQFDLHTRNEIDDLVTEHRLDALVSDGQSAAFHGACKSGYPSLCEALEGTTLWIYGARWSRDSLPTLLRAYRQVSA